MTGRYLVDLPGYGYAKVPEAVQARWEACARTTYLRKPRALRGLVLVMDARHPLTPLDRRMLDWFARHGQPVHVLLTKADKLSRQAAQRQLTQTWEALARLYPAASVQLFSSVSLLGLDEARAARCTTADRRPIDPARAENRGRGLESTPWSRGRIDAEKENPRLKGSKPGVKPQLD